MLYEPDVVKQLTLLNDLLPKIIDIQVAKRTSQISNEIKELQNSVDTLITSIDDLQNPQEYLDTIIKNLEVIKDYMPNMKEQIDKVLYELYAPLNTTQKLKIAIPIIPLIVSYETETNIPKLLAEKIYASNVPKLVTEKIQELKNLILNFKGF